MSFSIKDMGKNLCINKLQSRIALINRHPESIIPASSYTGKSIYCHQHLSLEMKFILQIVLIAAVCFFAQETHSAALPAKETKIENGLHKPEFVAGFVLYRIKNGEIEYLLIKKKGENDWTPPKGRLEDNEDQMVSAVREMLEETSVYPTKYTIWDFRQIFEYTTGGGNLKRVDLWPARLNTPDHAIIIDPSEQDAYEWLSFTEAQSIIKTQFRDSFVVVDQYVRILESVK